MVWGVGGNGRVGVGQWKGWACVAEPSDSSHNRQHAVNGKTNVAVQMGGWWVSGGCLLGAGAAPPVRARARVAGKGDASALSAHGTE